MRPRPQGRGDAKYGREAGAGHVLLQCGHGRRAVETPIVTEDVGKTNESFNAATAAGPWRRSRGGLRNTAPSGFNAATAAGPWRPSRGRYSPASQRGCFNAATAAGPW